MEPRTASSTSSQRTRSRLVRRFLIAGPLAVALVAGCGGEMIAPVEAPAVAMPRNDDGAEAWLASFASSIDTDPLVAECLSGAGSADSAENWVDTCRTLAETEARYRRCMTGFTADAAEHWVSTCRRAAGNGER